MLEDQLWPVFAVLSVFALLGVSIAYMVRSRPPRWRIRNESQYRNIVELAKLDSSVALRAYEAERERRRLTCQHERTIRFTGGHKLCSDCVQSLCECCRDEDSLPGDAA